MELNVQGYIDYTRPLSLYCMWNPKYHLLDAFLELCKTYQRTLSLDILSCLSHIIIPISSCTAERSLSALKRVIDRLCSMTSMGQGRLEARFSY